MGTKTVQAPRQQDEKLPLGKKLLFGFVYAVFMLVTLAIVGEVALRVLPLGKFRSAPFRQYDPQLGVSLIPNMDVIHSRGCFTGHVVTNRWGFRDRGRTLEKPPGEFRIALVGDSVVEGVHVNPDQVMNIQMEKELQQQGYKNVEVLNFGIEGIGTTQELIMYKERIRQFHPDLVILTVSDNDIMNNSSTLQPKSYGIHTWYCPYYNLDSNGNLVFQPVQTRHFNGLITFLERHSYLAYYVERIWFRADLPLYRWHGMPVYFGSYSDDPLDPEWQSAWTVTEKVMAKMRDTVQADGVKFVMVPWSNFSDIQPDWRERLTTQFGPLPKELVPQKLDQRLQQIASRENITIASLTPFMQTYRDQHHLQWPYFSLPCDPHFSALGHQVAAEGMVDLLERQQWLPAQSSAN
ncbi:MAG TPA: SGNH/GDSL hydrolase family protein [Candidatus Sulfotelmatobacter sp.]